MPLSRLDPGDGALVLIDRQRGRRLRVTALVLAGPTRLVDEAAIGAYAGGLTSPS